MTRRTPPMPSGTPILGQTLAFARDPFGLVATLLDEHGRDDVVGLDVVGMDDLYVLAHPDYVERLLVRERDAVAKGPEFERAFGDAVIAAEGDAWRTQRDALDPFFQWDRVRDYTDAMRRQAERRIADWEPGTTRAVEREMKDLTLDVIFATVLGRELDEDDDRLRAAADGLNGRFAPSSWVLPEWVPTPSRLRFARAASTLRSEVRRLTEIADDDSLTGALADARGSPGYPESDDSLENQLVGMVFAGHETTALALTFTWYLLARYPDVDSRLAAELDRVVGDDPITAEHLSELEYTERVLKEALRLYPPVHTIPRETTRPIEVGDRVVPAGTDVQLAVYHIHRDERFYDRPLEFRPERWAGETDADRHPYAYVPFGAGPRSCLGRAFALTEAKVVLATVAREYRLTWAGDGRLDLRPEMTTQPVGDVPMTVRPR